MFMKMFKKFKIMSTQIVNFKSIKVSAVSLDEAIASVEDHFHICGNATQALKNAKVKHTGTWTERDEKAWMLDYCNAKNHACPGTGFYYVIESAVADSRERPYKFENVKNEGKRKEKKTYTWIDDETGLPVVKVRTNKTDAENALKNLYKSGEYRGNAKCVITKEYIEGESVVSVAKYTPSTSARKGTWVFFGVEKA